MNNIRNMFCGISVPIMGNPIVNLSDKYDHYDLKESSLSIRRVNHVHN